MVSNRKRSPKPEGAVKVEKFPWTDDLVVKLLKSLKEYHRENSYNQGFDWAVVNREFAKLHGLELPIGVAKNKTEHMKKQWRNWVELMYIVTGRGWDPVIEKFTMSDEWWDRQDKKTLDKYHVSGREVSLRKLVTLWDDVYANIVATGKNVMSPTMDQTAAVGLISNVCDDDSGTQQGDRDAGMGKPSAMQQLIEGGAVDEQFRAIVARVRTDGLDDKFLASIHDTLTTPPTHDMMGTGGDGSDKLDDTPGDLASGRKKRKKPSMASILFNKHIAQVGQIGNRVLSLLEGDVGSTSQSGGVVERPYAFSECLDVLKRMVSSGFIEDESEMWCIGVSKLAKEKNRNVFMSIEHDSQCKVWMKFEMKLLGLDVPN